MTKTFFDNLAEKRESDIAMLDRTKFGPMIRNHLVQLFRKAHAVDDGLEGVLVGMGGISIQGTFRACYNDDCSYAQITANDYKYMGGITVEHPEAEAFLKACEEYDECGLACDVPIADITLDDLKTRSSVKAKVWKGRS